MSYSRNLPKAIKILHPNIFPKSGSGSWIESSKGVMYLEFTSGIGALSTGHSHPNVINKVVEQVNKYVHMPQQLFNIHDMRECRNDLNNSNSVLKHTGKMI